MILYIQHKNTKQLLHIESRQIIDKEEENQQLSSVVKKSNVYKYMGIALTIVVMRCNMSHIELTLKRTDSS